MGRTPRQNVTEAELAKVWIGTQRDPAFDGLRSTGANFVPGAGQCVTSPVAFVGEAPGATEDQQRLPFVGQAGRLLDQLIEQELGLSRDEVWVTNVVKYRPTDNRTPIWAERLAGRPYLGAELEIVQPRVIVPLGAVTLSLLRPQPITRLHGQPFTRGRWTYLPMFHPAYLLRRRDLLPEARADFAQLRRLLNLEEPDAGN